MFRARKDKPKTANRRSFDTPGRDGAERVDVSSLVIKYCGERTPTEAPSPEPDAESTDGPGATISYLRPADSPDRR